MNRRFLTCITAVLFVVLPATVLTQPVFKTGVLCSYGIVVGLRSYQRACRPELDAEIAFFDRLTRRHRTFVAENGEWTEKRIEEFEIQNQVTADQCGRADLEGMLADILQAPEEFERFVETNLATGRRPEWGVCL